MLTIIIGIIIFLGLCWKMRERLSSSVFTTIFSIVSMVTFSLGVVATPKGYTDWEIVKKVELVTLSDSMCYVSVSADNTYRYEIESELKIKDTDSYKVESIKGENIEKVEEENCIGAQLCEYHRSGKKSIWSLALLSDETKYVFFIPKGISSQE